MRKGTVMSNIVKSGCNARVLAGSGTFEGLVQFTWSPDNPAQVTMHTYLYAQPELGWVEWIYSRDLLAEGLCALAPTWAGLGDVKVTTWDLLNVRIELSPPAGTATIVVPWSVVDLFLRNTFAVVPADGEGDAYELVTRVWIDEILRAA
jgi:hypothetical protein